MLYKICALICAFSTSITAIFCVWIACNMISCDRAATKAFESLDRDFDGINRDFSKMQKKVTSDLELAKERAQIERQLNSRKTNPTVFTLPHPVRGARQSSDAVSRPIADQIIQDTRDALKKREQDLRDSYQGFPGNYESDPQRYEKLKK